MIDEDLRSYLSVKLPASSARPLQPVTAGESSTPSPSQPQPPRNLLNFIHHLQVTVDSSYVSPLSAEGSGSAPPSPSSARHEGSHYPFPASPTGLPSTPTRRASGALSTLPAHLARRVSGGQPLPAGSPTPSTPLPIPSVGSYEERKYVRAEGISVFSALWTPAADNGIYLAWSAEENLWIAVWGLDVPVAFVRTKISDPLLCLTASITLRDKATASSLRGFETSDLLTPSSSETSPTLQEAEEEIIHLSIAGNDDLLEGLSKATFPAARFRGPQPSISSHPTLSQSQGPKVVPPTTLLSLPTLRKSFRSVLELGSGLSLRMRTVYLPHLDINETAAGGSEGNEDEEEERKVVVSVEVESSGGPQLGFAIESIDFLIGSGSGAIARAELLDEDQGLLPLELTEGDQHSLLYIVSIEPTASPGPDAAAHHRLPSASLTAFQPRSHKQGSLASHAPLVAQPAPALPESHRPVTISVRGRPFVYADEPSGERDYPTAAFVSKWNCTLDLSQLAEASEEKLNLPAMAGVPSVLASTSAAGRSGQRPPSIVAGNKRFSLANVSSLAQPVPPPKHAANGQSSTQRGRDSLAQPLPTPAFPPQSAAPVLPPSQQPFAGSGQPHALPATTPSRVPDPRDPVVSSEEQAVYEREEDGILVSITVLRLGLSGEYAPLRRKDAIRPLEPFVLEVFVFNGTATVRRFDLGVPEKRRRRPVDSESAGPTEGEGWVGACGLGVAGAPLNHSMLAKNS